LIHSIRINSEFLIEVKDFADIQQALVQYAKSISSRKLVKYFEVCINGITDPDERKYMEILLKNIPEF
jgi:hypothetical protein